MKVLIITRAFRATGVGIDLDGIERQHIIFPNFQTYVAPQKDEVHNETPLTEAEVKSLADIEQAFQKAQKERLEAERKEAKRQRSIARINKL